MIEPTAEENLGILFIEASEKGREYDFEAHVQKTLQKLKPSYINRQLPKIVEHEIRAETSALETSMGMVRELVEYESVGDVHALFKTNTILRSFTGADIVSLANTLFTPEHLTIGYVSKKPSRS